MCFSFLLPYVPYHLLFAEASSFALTRWWYGLPPELANAPPPAIALVGTPGTGKSTLLNGLAGAAVFATGDAPGTGCTTTLARHAAPLVTLYDTPGLAGAAPPAAVARALNALLAADEALRLVFVATLQHGRVRADDARALDAVLSALASNTDLTNRFAVVLNRMSPRVLARLRADKPGEAKVRAALTGRFRTQHWFYVPTDDALDGAGDGRSSVLMNLGLARFLRAAPVTKRRFQRAAPVDARSTAAVLDAPLPGQLQREAAHRARLARMVALREAERLRDAERIFHAEGHVRDLQIKLDTAAAAQRGAELRNSLANADVSRTAVQVGQGRQRLTAQRRRGTALARQAAAMQAEKDRCPVQ